MITYKNGNIFESECEALVNPVNTVGVMGRGLALQFKQRYPEMFKEYRALCDKRLLRVGTLHFYRDNSGKMIVNFPTKADWRKPSRLTYVVAGLVNLTQTYKDLDIKSIAIPPLGCGLGGLEWEEVKEQIEIILSPTDLEIEVYQP